MAPDEMRRCREVAQATGLHYSTVFNLMNAGWEYGVKHGVLSWTRMSETYAKPHVESEFEGIFDAASRISKELDQPYSRVYDLLTEGYVWRDGEWVQVARSYAAAVRSGK